MDRLVQTLLPVLVVLAHAVALEHIPDGLWEAKAGPSGENNHRGFAESQLDEGGHDGCVICVKFLRVRWRD